MLSIAVVDAFVLCVGNDTLPIRLLVFNRVYNCLF